MPHKYRWTWLLAASYYFYMNWNPAYAILIFGSTIITYLCSLLLEKYQKDKGKRRLFLTISLIINFGVLFLFKYFNFVNETVFSVMEYLGIRWAVPNLDILLPVGISFYTFQAIGYTIDVYRGDLKAERHLGIYALFVSFFPQLVAGPIERASNLLPQFREKHVFSSSMAIDGLKLMLWGYFMKVVVADRLAVYVDAVYNNVGQHNGTSLLLASILFSFQIYGDFAGYSFIAIGAAKIMGFRLMTNFKRPYFATSIKAFWSRWHISLSTWFKDYLYIPLGGNRVSRKRHYYNLFVTFLVSGVWHGANMTFVIWGGVHGLYQVAENALGRLFKGAKLPSLIKMSFTYVIVLLAWVFFRANTMQDAMSVITKIFVEPGRLFIDQTTLVYSFIGLSFLLVKEAKDEFDIKISFSNSNNLVVRYAYYIAIICSIMLFGVFDSSQFIYFQF